MTGDADKRAVPCIGSTSRAEWEASQSLGWGHTIRIVGVAPPIATPAYNISSGQPTNDGYCRSALNNTVRLCHAVGIDGVRIRRILTAHVAISLYQRQVIRGATERGSWIGAAQQIRMDGQNKKSDRPDGADEDGGNRRHKTNTTLEFSDLSTRCFDASRQHAKQEPTSGRREDRTSAVRSLVPMVGGSIDLAPHSKIAMTARICAVLGEEHPAVR
jgi:hypothetical protein